MAAGLVLKNLVVIYFSLGGENEDRLLSSRKEVLVAVQGSLS